MVANDPERKPLTGIDVFPISDRQPRVRIRLQEIMREEVNRWEAVAPGMFTDENYYRFRRWAQETCREGFQEVQMTDETRIKFLPMTDLSLQYALVLTQQSYPFHGLPETFALAMALNLDNVCTADEFASYGDFDSDIRTAVADRSRLAGWLMDNPRIFPLLS
ncbi:hypothetical protein HY612_05175 [Candidatus Roizmanbacteria bacterium]|nr:hypothetical protein [Candidatus Roizmanbacteria bacterium]